MKKIKIIPEITIRDVPLTTGGSKDLPFDMIKFLNTCMNQHEKFGKGLAGVSQGLKIKNSFEKAKTSFQLEDAEYEELKRAVNNAGLSPQIAMACQPFYQAIEDALDVEIPKTAAKTGKKK